MTQHAVSSEIRGVNFLTQRAVSMQIGSVNIISVASQLQILLDHLLQLLGPDGGTCVVYIYLGSYLPFPRLWECRSIRGRISRLNEFFIIFLALLRPSLGPRFISYPSDMYRSGSWHCWQSDFVRLSPAAILSTEGDL